VDVSALKAAASDKHCAKTACVTWGLSACLFKCTCVSVCGCAEWVLLGYLKGDEASI